MMSWQVDHDEQGSGSKAVPQHPALRGYRIGVTLRLRRDQGLHEGPRLCMRNALTGRRSPSSRGAQGRSGPNQVGYLASPRKDHDEAVQSMAVPVPTTAVDTVDDESCEVAPWGAHALFAATGLRDVPQWCRSGARTCSARLRKFPPPKAPPPPSLAPPLGWPCSGCSALPAPGRGLRGGFGAALLSWPPSPPGLSSSAPGKIRTCAHGLGNRCSIP